MSPAGRPPISDSRKDNRFIVMLTDAELESIKAGAAAAGKPMSTWARDELLRLAAEAAAKKSKRK